MTSSTSAPSRLVRSISSRAASRARSTARASLSTVPALQNGVRYPATTATRRPFPTGIRFSPSLTTKPTTTPKWRGVGRGDTLLPSDARRRVVVHGGRAGGPARDRRRHHRRRHRAGRRVARLPGRAGGEGGLRLRHVVALLTPHS